MKFCFQIVLKKPNGLLTGRLIIVDRPTVTEAQVYIDVRADVATWEPIPLENVPIGMSFTASPVDEGVWESIAGFTLKALRPRS